MSNIRKLKEYQDRNRVEDDDTEETEDYFKQLARKNKETKERMAKDRAKANRSVLRSFRIK